MPFRFRDPRSADARAEELQQLRDDHKREVDAAAVATGFPHTTVDTLPRYFKQVGNHSLHIFEERQSADAHAYRLMQAEELIREFGATP